MAQGVKTGGRKAGTPNKFTRTVREVFTTVFNDLQTDKVSNLKEWAKKNTTDFYKLASKLIPNDVELTAHGKTHFEVRFNNDETTTN